MGKHQAFNVPICGNEKALKLGAWCLICETFLYLSGVIHLIGRCLIGEVLRYIHFCLAAVIISREIISIQCQGRKEKIEKNNSSRNESENFSTILTNSTTKNSYPYIVVYN